MAKVSAFKRFSMRRESVFFAKTGCLNQKKVKVPKIYVETPLDLWDSKENGSLEKPRTIKSEEKRHRKHTDENKAQLKAEFDIRIGKTRSCSRSHKLHITEDAEDTFKTTRTPVKRLRDSKLDEISESDQIFADDSNDEYLQLHNRTTEKITKSLNPMLKVANYKVRQHNELLNRFYKCFYLCFDVDEEYSEDLEKDYLFPEELLSKPDLDFGKLQELPFDFRTSLVTIRSLVRKMHSCRQKCGRQLDVILNVILRKIQQAKSLKDKSSLCTSNYQELSKELEHMKLLLKKFSICAECCNTQLEKILMDVILIREDFLV